MTSMQIKVEHPIEGGVRLGVEPCSCGGCHPTATAYEGDPQYERHEPALAEDRAAAAASSCWPTARSGLFGGPKR